MYDIHPKIGLYLIGGKNPLRQRLCTIPEHPSIVEDESDSWLYFFDTDGLVMRNSIG